MSVEDARVRLEDSFYATATRQSHDALAAWLYNRRNDPSLVYGSLDMAMNDLILEVRAEMPCEYAMREYDGDGLLTVCRCPRPCRSCTARRTLVEWKARAAAETAGVATSINPDDFKHPPGMLTPEHLEASRQRLEDGA